MARARLANRPVIVPIKLTLHRGEDDDLIDWFTNTPSRLRSAAVKAALRGGVNTATGSDAIDDQVAAALESLIG